jgi:hypothetical protein
MHLIHLRLTLSAKNESPWRVHLFNLRNIMVSYRMLALNHYVAVYSYSACVPGLCLRVHVA